MERIHVHKRYQVYGINVVIYSPKLLKVKLCLPGLRGSDSQRTV